MQVQRRKALLAGALMACGYAGAVTLRPTRHLADMRPKVNLETLFPSKFGVWAVDDRMPVQLVSPDTAALLSKIYNQTLSRTYVSPDGIRIMLSVAYGGDQSDATRVHRPEVCYPAQGFQIMANSTGTMDVRSHSIPVRRLVARQGNRNEPITYWIVVGDTATVTSTDQKIVQLSYGLNGIVPDGVLMRVSSIDQDERQAFELQHKFVNDMFLALAPAQRDFVFGSAAASQRVSAGA